MFGKDGHVVIGGYFGYEGPLLSLDIGKMASL